MFVRERVRCDMEILEISEIQENKTEKRTEIDDDPFFRRVVNAKRSSIERGGQRR